MTMPPPSSDSQRQRPGDAVGGVVPTGVLPLRVLAITHATASLDLRERLYLGDPDTAERVVKLLWQRWGPEGIAILSTCNRTEIYATPGEASAFEDFGLAAAEALAATSGVDPATILNAGRVLCDEEALRHLFRVAAGLDAVVLGEDQILGQVKVAQQVARQRGWPDPGLDRLFSMAVRAGKRVRAETHLNEGAVSVASAGIELAQKVLGDLSHARALFVGLGEMGRLALRHFLAAGGRPERTRLTNRTIERATRLAGETGASVVSLADIHEAAASSDLVVLATGAGEPLLTCARFSSCSRRGRRQGPMCILDLGVPRNAEARIGESPLTFLHGVDDLGNLMDANLARRRVEIPRVEAILAAVEDEFTQWMLNQRLVPVMQRFDHRLEALRQAELDRARKRFPEETHADLDKLTRRLLEKVLYLARTKLRDAGVAAISDPESTEQSGRKRRATEQYELRLQAFQEIFGLDDPADGGDEDDS